MKRILSILLVVILALCITATAENEPYTYTVLTFQAGVLDDDAYMVNYWNQKFGVNFEIDSVEQASANELMPLRIADGNIPDILYWSRDQYIKLVEEGLLGTFSAELVRKYAPKIMAEMESFEGLVDWCSIDGELFCLGYVPYTALYPTMAVWRDSWLEAVGEEVPRTLDDAERVWYAFTTEDPDGDGIDNTYGLSKGGMTAVYNAYGLYTDWIMGEDGQLVNSNVSPRRREALEKLAQYYADGVLDPEFLTGENYGGYWGISHAFTGGRIGYTMHGNYTHWLLYNERTTADSDANAGAMYQTFPDEVSAEGMPYVYAEPLTGLYGDKVAGTAGYGFTVAFSADFVKDEARFGRVLEIAEELGGYNDQETYLCSRFGERGVHWDYNEDGKYQCKEGYASTAEQVAIGGMITFQFAMSQNANDALLDVARERAIAYIKENLDYRTAPVYVVNTLPSAGIYSEDLNKLTSETFNDIITGVKPIEAFDDMVEQWYQNGGDVLTQEANELYN